MNAPATSSVSVVVLFAALMLFECWWIFKNDSCYLCNHPSLCEQSDALYCIIQGYFCCLAYPHWYKSGGQNNRNTCQCNAIQFNSTTNCSVQNDRTSLKQFQQKHCTNSISSSYVYLLVSSHLKGEVVLSWNPPEGFCFTKIFKLKYIPMRHAVPGG